MSASSASSGSRSHAREVDASVLEWEATFDAIQDPIAVADADGFIARANHAFELRFGAPGASVIGSLDLRVLFRAGSDAAPRATSRVGYRTYETDQLRVPGSFLVSHYPIQLGRGPGVVYHLTDLNARKAAEQAARRGEEQLRQAQKTEAVGRLAGGVAHDFSNLLTAILMASEQLLEPDPPAAQVEALARQIQDAAQRGAALTRRLLGFSRAQPVRPEVLDLAPLLEGLVRLLRPLLGADIEIELRHTPDRHRVFLDRSQIEQVAMNLAINARDAMPRGGRLTMALRNLEPEEGEGRAMLEWRVSDTGAGMDEATLARACEPFFTTKPEGKGTGLGLATVQSIVTQNGGELQMTSTPGRGTEVRILLPAARDSDGAPAGEAGPEVTACGHEVVLLADDDEGVRQVVQALLERLGYRVLEAADAAAALALAEQHTARIDLLLTDLVMPGMNGGELAATLRARRPEIKVLLMSGHSPDSERYRQAAGLALPLLRKPFRSAELASKLREVLEG